MFGWLRFMRGEDGTRVRGGIDVDVTMQKSTDNFQVNKSGEIQVL